MGKGASEEVCRRRCGKRKKGRKVRLEARTATAAGLFKKNMLLYIKKLRNNKYLKKETEEND